MKEAVLALRMERRLTKDQILGLYLSRVYLGSGAYGAESAALRYFGRSLKALDLSEISLIAGLAPAPSRYSPLNNFPAARKRQWYVLSRMSQEGFISQTRAVDAYNKPLQITGRPIAMFTQYPYVTEYIRSLVIKKYGDGILSKGIGIQTTVDPRLQGFAEMAVRKGAIELEWRQGRYRGLSKMSDTQKKRCLALQKNQIAWQGLRPYYLYWAQVTGVDPLQVDMSGDKISLGAESYAWIAPKGAWKPEGTLRSGDMIRLCYNGKGFVISQQPQVQASLMALDVKTGGILAMVGGISFSKSQFNRAVKAQRQSGSAIKPFIYAAAIDKGLTPADIIFDVPLTYKDEKAEGEDEGEDETQAIEAWRPKNYKDRFYGPTSLRTGLVLSRNVVTIKILEDIGIGYAIEYLNRFDLGKKMPHDLSIALGTGSVNLLHLSGAYAVFANHGKAVNSHIIEYITRKDVGPIFSARDESIRKQVFEPDRKIISEQTAYILTSLLDSVVQDGTGWRAKAIKRPVAGKTGTSDDNRDAWFIGYTPDILCGVWVGYDDMMPLGENETGSRAACPIFTGFMEHALKDYPVNDFAVPEGVVFARVDTHTGRLASPGSKDVRFECFKEGNLPPSPASSFDRHLLKEVY